MQVKVSEFLEKHRVTWGKLKSTSDYGFNGAFMLPDGMRVICSDGDGWDHVSASYEDRCPTWDEMCALKDLFFDKHEMVLQYHPAEADYVNHHPFTLHLWKPQGVEVPKPPMYMVGPKS